MAEVSEIDPSVPPSGTGCAECLDAGGWWVHLRRCAACGHVGCCDSSPGQHRSAHFRETGHPVMTSFEPGESWFYDFRSGESLDGPSLAPPESRPEGQPSPGPAGAVPTDWLQRIHR
ncbi:UBP-type zinc finger domain-containing protein [Phycicoccus flavus]|uniref:UBP-type zinc finger domain-containing protein n=1 Tax=Phycicoccus flavus TaxID=2502783 RepID=UPI000FEB740B|nr:UBP-type zinc finger domain-containing protein [Phycicoccus flavus]NHA67911.1 UBP-type zinc finger domain-containing protein [Phycicoccus flavus]